MSWRLEEYTIESLSNDIENDVINVPKYQRGAVWNKSQKKKLIDSMNNGFPFGSILLYDNGNVRKIIDGLQRSTTIMEYIKNPADFFEEDDLNHAYINKIVNEIGVVSAQESLNEKVETIIKNWVKDNHKSMNDVQRMQFSDCADLLVASFPTLDKKRDVLKELLKEMFKEYQDTCQNISNIKIPALVYKGDEALLPEIFERINSQGAKLTKQEIYAASWSSYTVKLNDNSNYLKILDINRDRYDHMLDDSMSLDDYNSTEFIRNKTVNIFELVFGFGKYISSKYPYLFKYDPDDCTKVESVGFNLINACLLQKSANMGKLNIAMRDLIGLDGNDIEKFLIKLEDCINYVDRRLGSASKFKGNTRNNSKISPLHTEMQIVSIIATVFVQRHVSYEVDDEENVSNVIINLDSFNPYWGTMKNTFDKNIIKMYSMDIISQKWKGSGDKKLDNIIINKFHYNKEVSWEEYETTLDAYYHSMNSERNERKQVKNPNEPEKILLNIIYSNIFTAADQTDESNYDIEHLATKNLMKNKICSYSDDFRLPISSIANLCLLPEYDNRTKQDKTLYDDSEYLSKVDINRIQDKFSFTKKEDFDWLNEELTESEFRNAYINFLDIRFDKMKEKIKQSIF